METTESSGETVINKIKRDRDILRRVVRAKVQKSVESSAAGGFFPGFESIIKDVMETVAEAMDANTDVPIQIWSIILQEKQPDKFCKKTMSLIGESCESNAVDVERKKMKPISENIEDLLEEDSATAKPAQEEI